MAKQARGQLQPVERPVFREVQPVFHGRRRTTRRWATCSRSSRGWWRTSRSAPAKKKAAARATAEGEPMPDTAAEELVETPPEVEGPVDPAEADQPDVDETQRH